jgi:hypothetical protein
MSVGAMLERTIATYFLGPRNYVFSTTPPPTSFFQHRSLQPPTKQLFNKTEFFHFNSSEKYGVMTEEIRKDWSRDLRRLAPL